MQARRAVLFDLFHTLACVAPPSERGAGVAEVLGVDAVEWRRIYYVDDVFGRCVGKVRDPIECMRLTARAVDPEVSDARIMEAADLRARAFEEGLVAIEPGFLDAIDALRAAGIRVALVSDAGADDVMAWERSPLAGRMDAAVFSHEVGVRKPHPRMYESALQALGVSAGQATFVGDGGSDELKGARALGMRTALVTRLADAWWPGRAMTRAADADEVHADVAAFVAALLRP